MESSSSNLIMLMWISILLLLFNSNNFINLLLLSESLWVVIYTLSSILGIVNDDIVIMSLTFLSLGLAGLEFSIGILLISAYKSNTGQVLVTNL